MAILGVLIPTSYTPIGLSLKRLKSLSVVARIGIVDGCRRFVAGGLNAILAA